MASSIAVVGTAGREELLGGMMQYLAALPPETRVYTIDTGDFHKSVVETCKTYKLTCVVMRRDEARFGTAANVKRDVALAKEVDKVIAFWDFRDGEVSLVITMAKLWGKLINVNPHEQGGIVSSNRLKASDFGGIGQQVESTDLNSVSGGSNPPTPSNRPTPKIDCGICGFDDDEDEVA